MNKRKLVLALAFSAGLFALGILYWHFHPTVLVSDPTIPRPNPDYEKLLSPQPASPPIATNVFGSIQTSTNNGRVEISIAEDRARQAGEVFGFNVLKASPQHKSHLGEGSLFLKYIAVAWDAPKSNFQYSVQTPARFFTAALDPVPVDEVRPKVNSWDRKLDFRGEFPQVKFLFGITNVPSWKLLGADIFDGRTRFSLSSGYSSSSTADGFYFETSLGLWHKAPVHFFLHLAHGEPQHFDITPGDHTEKQAGPARIKLAAIIGRSSSGHSSSSDGRTNRITLNFAAEDEKSQTAVVLFVWPGAHRAPLAYEILGEDNQQLETAGSSTSGVMHLVNVRATPDRIKTIRVLLYPENSRILFELPFIPGLPLENADLSNLFSVRVPYVRITSEWEFRSNIEKLVQLNIPFQNMKFPQGLFPIIYTNKTAQEILEHYLNYAPEQKQIQVNHTTGSLEFRDPPLIEIWKRIKGVFK